ncbi:transmembrane protein 18 [Globomyces pollinis-pini]|nr:transmembrane protein 18 [Globomyces pollinis-pini]
MPTMLDSLSSEWKFFMTNAYEFTASVNWTEPFLLSLYTFHLSIFLLITLFPNLRVHLLIILASIGFQLESINKYLNFHHHQFTTINYFDRNGVFLTSVLGLPIIFNLSYILIGLVRSALNLMVQVKTQQLKNQQRKKLD